MAIETLTKPTQYTITEKEFKTLQDIEGQLIGLTDIVFEVDKFAPISIILKPILDNFCDIKAEKIGGAE